MNPSFILRMQKRPTCTRGKHEKLHTDQDQTRLWGKKPLLRHGSALDESSSCCHHVKVCLQRSFFWNRSSQNSSQKIEPGVYDKFRFQAYVLVKKRHRTLCWLAYVPSLISLTFIESSEISFLVNVQYVVPAFCAQGFSSYSTYFKRPLGPPWHFRF